MDVVRASLAHLPRTAIVSGDALYRYRDVLAAALQVCHQLQASQPQVPASAAAAAAAPSTAVAAAAAAAPPLCGPRVALMCDPGAGYVAGTFGAWLQGGIAVPLCLSHPDRELQYVLEDAGVSAVLASPQHAERMHRLAQPFAASVHLVEPQLEAAANQHPQQSQPQQQQQQQSRRQQQQQQQQQPGLEQQVTGLLDAMQQQQAGALIIYTSGTTGRPKGALHTHASLAAQVRTLCTAWEWQAEDRILHSLPLHHVHGVVNALLCALYSGACVEVMQKFSPSDAWHRLERREEPISVFMGVPTMYSFLLSTYDAMAPEQQRSAAKAASALRLAVSGSAACPLPTMQRWEALSGQRLLERYGMTETGMILGNPLKGERRPGIVGLPFDGVEVQVTQDDGSDAGTGPGELRVRSQQLFREYWGRPQATAEAFDAQGYFLTGDTAVVEEGGYYRLLGRTSVDVIKHGGYKISALHIESVLLEHPILAEVAVLGLPDDTHGQRIAVVAALKQQQDVGKPATGELALPELRAWASERLPKYQLPSELKLVPAIPRNAMGKVNKKALAAQLFPQAPAGASAPAAAGGPSGAGSAPAA